MFRCDQCGECCRHLDQSPLYSNLHEGNGVCRYLRGNLCSIYDERPLLCRIDACYPIFFADQMTYEEYLQLNYEACKEFKKQKAHRNLK